MKEQIIWENNYFAHVKFYQVDLMKIVWHGHYVEFLEEARSALMQALGYDYEEMMAENIAWPIVKLEIKYIQPLLLKENIRISTQLIEYEDRIVIHYVFYDENNVVKSKAKTVQMAVNGITGETLFTGSPTLVQNVKRKLSETHTNSEVSHAH